MLCMQYTVIAKVLDYQFMPDLSIGAPTILYVPPLIFSNGYSLEVKAILDPDSPRFMMNLDHSRSPPTSTGRLTRLSRACCSSPPPTPTSPTSSSGLKSNQRRHRFLSPFNLNNARISIFKEILILIINMFKPGFQFF